MQRLLSGNQWVDPMETLLELMWAMAVLGLLVIGLWMTIDCATQESIKGNTKRMWSLIILLTGWIGVLINYLYQHPQRERSNKICAGL
ncbi:hypothetical protein MK139_09815 [bacterium]|nr:hypothetical protein [bacterium]